MIYWGPSLAIDDALVTEEANGKRLNMSRFPLVFFTYIIVVGFYTVGMHYVKRQKMFLVDHIKNS